MKTHNTTDSVVIEDLLLKAKTLIEDKKLLALENQMKM